MPVVPLTIIISLTLVFSFVMFFLSEHARGRVSSVERDSLLPLTDETPRLAHARVQPDSTAHDEACPSEAGSSCNGRLQA